jgi:hypothetical protein
MLKAIDRVFGALLILAACGHTAGTVLRTPFMSGIFVWSLGSSLAAFLLAALHLVRAGRPWDRPLAGIAAVGTACWILVALGFGVSIGNVVDPRVMTQAGVSAVLVGFSVRTLVRGAAGGALVASPSS